MKNGKNTPGSIKYRVDVYKKNEIGICKGYFRTYFDAVCEAEHNNFVNDLTELVPCTQITAVYINPNGDEKNINVIYFI